MATEESREEATPQPDTSQQIPLVRMTVYYPSTLGEKGVSEKIHGRRWSMPTTHLKHVATWLLRLQVCMYGAMVAFEVGITCG